MLGGGQEELIFLSPATIIYSYLFSFNIQNTPGYINITVWYLTISVTIFLDMQSQQLSKFDSKSLHDVYRKICTRSDDKISYSSEDTASTRRMLSVYSIVYWLERMSESNKCEKYIYFRENNNS